MVDRIVIAATWAVLGALFLSTLFEGHPGPGALIGAVLGYFYAMNREKKIEDEIFIAKLNREREDRAHKEWQAKAWRDREEAENREEVTK